ncbi:MAG TPA: efflux RND transporter periplasmic adaptor subunit [Pseudobdellovibrionaceae bacterium]|nr:efflux RND transporter periplasmic adaptor subunit [Pseudobdellovibrionaceae bacterium]
MLKIWIIIILIVLSGAGIYFFKYSDNQKSYVEFPVEPRDIEVSILATGTVQPENRLEIKAPISGRIDEVLVKEGQKVAKGQVLARMSSIDRAALIDAARSQGSDEIKKWQDIYRATPIIAPLSGMIIRRNIEPGQTIANTEAILVMSNHLTVNAQVDETDLAKIKLKQKAEIFLDAYPENKIPAQVDQIAFEAKTVNNVTTYTVIVLPETVPEMMRSGMTANISFILDKKESVLSIPNEVLQTKEGVVQVLLKNTTKTPQEVVIEVGVSNGKYTEVLSGLKKGDIVLREEIKGQSSNSTNPFSPIGAGRRSSGTGKH